MYIYNFVRARWYQGGIVVSILNYHEMLNFDLLKKVYTPKGILLLSI